MPRTIPRDTATDDGTPQMGVLRWLAQLLTGRPHFYIGGTERPYLLRWYLFPRNRWMNLYLHKFCRDDDDRALHDHPWWFVSVMLAGRYREYVTGEGAEGTDGGAQEQRSRGAEGVSGERSSGERAAPHHSQLTRHPDARTSDTRNCEIRRAGSIVFRQAEHRHRVELLKRDDGMPIPCWTLILTGPNVRTWGFWCPKGFVPWHDFVNMHDPGDIGPGCGA